MVFQAAVFSSIVLIAQGIRKKIVENARLKVCDKGVMIAVAIFKETFPNEVSLILFLEANIVISLFIR